VWKRNKRTSKEEEDYKLSELWSCCSSSLASVSVDVVDVVVSEGVPCSIVNKGGEGFVFSKVELLVLWLLVMLKREKFLSVGISLDSVTLAFLVGL
jgi:hypothetical protein